MKMDPHHEIRQRAASSHHHHHQEQLESGGIRVVSCSAAPRGNIRPYARRKPVARSSSDEEEERKVVEADVATTSSRHQTSTNVKLLLPSPLIERDREDKARWSDQQVGVEDHIAADASCVGSSQLEPLDSKDDYSHQAELISPSSAAITLESIARSLQWTQKFPQGLHLSRARSRMTLRSTHDDNSSTISTKNSKEARNMLAEVRDGLRLLAKRREDVLEETDEQEASRMAKWNYFKWALFLSTLIVFAYGTVGLIVSLLTWADAWDGAPVSVIVDRDLVICACGLNSTRSPSIIDLSASQQ
jgi:hypothetical protein